MRIIYSLSFTKLIKENTFGPVDCLFILVFNQSHRPFGLNYSDKLWLLVDLWQTLSDFLRFEIVRDKAHPFIFIDINKMLNKFK